MAWLLARGSGDLKQFMYLKEPAEEVAPIQEFKESFPGEEPAFLYDEDYPNPRLVEFYAHWCPHCQHFKPKYIEFARKMNEMTSNLPDGGIPGGGSAIEFFAVSCVPNKAICKKFEVEGYPSIRLFPARSGNATNLQQEDLRTGKILKLMGVSAERYMGPEKLVDTSMQWNERIPIGSGNFKSENFMIRSVKEAFEDAHLSFDFVMRHGVYISPGKLSKERKVVLEKFLSVLSKTLPESSSLHPVVSKSYKNIMELSRSDEKLQALMDEFPLPTKEWSPACLQHGTGYTCGLWTLFHIMAIGLAEWNSLSVDKEDRLAPLEVANALRDFIEHFFQCEECRMHFLTEYDACGHDLCNRLVDDSDKSTMKDWKELPLWLYETHNAVNARLRKERLENNEDEDTVSEWEVQWPPVSQCPNCWLSEGRWDEDHTYAFLRLQYWPEDYKSEDIRKKLYNSKGREYHIAPAKATERVKISTKQQTEESPSWIPHLASLFVLILIAYMWDRRRAFHKKGYHKKQDSSIDC